MKQIISDFKVSFKIQRILVTRNISNVHFICLLSKYIDSFILYFGYQEKGLNYKFFRNSFPDLFLVIAALKNFAKFTGKHMRRSFFPNKVRARDLYHATLLRRDSYKAAFLRIFRKNIKDLCFIERFQATASYI